MELAGPVEVLGQEAGVSADRPGAAERAKTAMKRMYRTDKLLK